MAPGKVVLFLFVLPFYCSKRCGDHGDFFSNSRQGAGGRAPMHLHRPSVTAQLFRAAGFNLISVPLATWSTTGNHGPSSRSLRRPPNVGNVRPLPPYPRGGCIIGNCAQGNREARCPVRVRARGPGHVGAREGVRMRPPSVGRWM